MHPLEVYCLRVAPSTSDYVAKNTSPWRLTLWLIVQTPRSSMIIKSFVALGFVIKIDDMFSENFPKEIKATAEDTVLIIGKDQNTYSKIFKRMKKDYKFNKNGIQWVRAF